jgi:carboxymethylenebutenolidase
MNHLIDADASRSGLDRRRVLVTSLTAGFALSVQPVAASTITTDAAGLEVGDVQIPVADGQIPGYRARPSGGGKVPVVIVIQEIFGIHEWIKDICRRFAKAGYLAVAPYLYSRQGDATAYADIRSLVEQVVSKVDDTVVLSDLDATIAWAVSQGGDAGRIGVTGFCWGGRQTWLHVAHNPQVKAGVAWYGQLVRREGNMAPRHPVEVAGQLRGRVLGLYGELDKGIPLTQVDAMRAALQAAGDKGCEIIVYPGADHGFLADYRPTYNEAAAKDAWGRCLAWFKAKGV